MIKLAPFPASLSPLNRGSLYYLNWWGGVGIFMPFINVYFAELGLNGRQIGILSAFAPLMVLIYAPLLSAVADRRRWRVPLLKWLIVGFALTLLLLNFARAFPALVVLMLVLALFHSPIVPVADSLIARMALRYGLNFGSMRLWGSVGFALTAIGSGALWEQVGFRPMFILAPLLLLPLIGLAGLLEEGGVIPKEDRPPLLDMRHDRLLMTILITAFLVGIPMGMAMTFEGVYMDYLGGSKLLVGMLPGLGAISEPPSMYYSVLVLQRLRGSKTLLLACGLLGTAFLGYVLSATPGMVLAFAIMKGLGFGLFYVTAVRLVTERVAECWSSTAQSTLFGLMFGLAPLLANPVGGVVYDLFGPAAVFVGGSAAMGVAMLLLVGATVRGAFGRD